MDRISDGFWISQREGGGFILRMVSPQSLEHVQGAAFCAVRAGYVASGNVPAKITMEVTPDGDLQIECSGAYCGWQADPLAESRANVMIAVIDTALRAHGYHPIDTPK